MSTNYEIINSQVIFCYDRNLSVRKRQFDYEEKLTEYFNIPFNNIAVSDEQDGNIPRFEGTSKHGYSKVQVTQYRTSLITTYQGEYRKNIELIKEYLSTRLKNIKELVADENNQFIAFIIELGFEFENDEKINSVLLESGSKAIKSETIDFSLQYSQKYNDDFFINVKCSKYTEGRFKLEKGIITPEGDQTKGISVILDMNSKLHHINKKEFNMDTLNLLEKETFRILSTFTLNDYLSGNIKKL